MTYWDVIIKFNHIPAMELLCTYFLLTLGYIYIGIWTDKFFFTYYNILFLPLSIMQAIKLIIKHLGTPKTKQNCHTTAKNVIVLPANWSQQQCSANMMNGVKSLCFPNHTLATIGPWSPRLVSHHDTAWLWGPLSGTDGQAADTVWWNFVTQTHARPSSPHADL